MKSQITVLLFGGRSLPRSMGSLRCREIENTPGKSAAIDDVVSGARRVVVVGTDADLSAVLSRLLRTDRLDVEVAHVKAGPSGWLGARRAMTAAAQRVPLIRDDTGTVLVRSASWLPPEESGRLHGEAVVDDTVLFDGEAPGVRIEPTTAMPGLRATVLGSRGWVSGRAAQLGTTGARVVRDGVVGSREVKRSTFYRHTTGWLRVG
jgi:hypothetical protein